MPYSRHLSACDKLYAADDPVGCAEVSLALSTGMVQPLRNLVNMETVCAVQIANITEVAKRSCFTENNVAFAPERASIVGTIGTNNQVFEPVAIHITNIRD